MREPAKSYQNKCDSFQWIVLTIATKVVFCVLQSEFYHTPLLVSSLATLTRLAINVHTTQGQLHSRLTFCIASWVTHC